MLSARYAVTIAIATLAITGATLPANAQPQTDDAILRESRPANDSPKVIRVGSVEIYDADEVYIETEGVRWGRGTLDGKAAVVGINNGADVYENRFTIRVVDATARTIRILQNGEYVNRHSYWQAYPSNQLSFYPIGGGPTVYGIFKVSDAGNGKVTLQESGVYISRFCCVPGGPAGQNAIVASFNNPASSGPAISLQLIRRPATGAATADAVRPAAPTDGRFPETFTGSVVPPTTDVLKRPTERACVQKIMNTALGVQNGRPFYINQNLANRVCLGAIVPDAATKCMIGKLLTLRDDQALSQCSVSNQRYLALGKDFKKPFIVNNTPSRIYVIILGEYFGDWNRTTHGIEEIGPGEFTSIRTYFPSPKVGVGTRALQLVFFTDKAKRDAFSEKLTLEGFGQIFKQFASDMLSTHGGYVVNATQLGLNAAGLTDQSGKKIQAPDGMFGVANLIPSPGSYTISGPGPSLSWFETPTGALQAPYPDPL